MSRINYPIAIIIILILSLALGLGVFWPKHQDLNNTSMMAKEKKEEIKTQKEYYSNIQSLSDELKKYESELSKINSALPSGFPTISLLNFLEKITPQAGLSLKNLSPGAVTSSLSGEDIQEARASFAISGSYSTFKNFLTFLEKSARLIEIENISFSSPSEKDNFDFNISIKAYSY